MFRAKTRARRRLTRVKTVERPFYPLLFSPQKIIRFRGRRRASCPPSSRVRRVRRVVGVVVATIAAPSSRLLRFERGPVRSRRLHLCLHHPRLNSPSKTRVFASSHSGAVSRKRRRAKRPKSLAEELCSLSVGAADASNGSFMERKKALEKALLMASLLEEAEAEVNDAKKTRKTSTMTVKKTKAEIERELVNHDVLGHYLNEIARFAYIRKTSHSGAVSRKRRRAKRPKDRVSNQKKPRQGLTRQDMRKEHRRWCVACQTLLKKEEALSVTKVLNVDVVSTTLEGNGDEEPRQSSHADFVAATRRKERRCKKEKTKKKLFPHSIPTPTYKIVVFDHKQRSKSNLPPNGRSVFVCRRVCCVNMLNARRISSNLKYKISSSSLSKKNNNSTSKKEETSDGGNSSGAEIMRDLKLLAEQAEREDGVDSREWKLVKPDGDANGRHPHRWREPPKWVKTC